VDGVSTDFGRQGQFHRLPGNSQKLPEFGEEVWEKGFHILGTAALLEAKESISQVNHL